MLESFEEVFSKYYGRVYRFILSMSRSEAVAEEITQQTFYKALNKMGSFEGRSDVGTWLCSIAKNEYLSHARKKREQSFEPSSAVFERTGDAIDETVQREEAHMRVHQSLHALSEPYREVFMLRVFGELQYAQIAALFDKSVSWARVTYYRAKLELQRVMEENENG